MHLRTILLAIGLVAAALLVACSGDDDDDTMMEEDAPATASPTASQATATATAQPIASPTAEASPEATPAATATPNPSAEAAKNAQRELIARRLQEDFPLLDTTKTTIDLPTSSACCHPTRSPRSTSRTSTPSRRRARGCRRRSR